MQWTIERTFPGWRNLLEVGCRTGFFLDDMRRGAPEPVLAGCDVLSEALARAKPRLPDVYLFQADARRLPVRRQFDVVTALDVLEHLDDDRAALDELYRVVVLIRPEWWLIESGISLPIGGSLIVVARRSSS